MKVFCKLYYVLRFRVSSLRSFSYQQSFEGKSQAGIDWVRHYDAGSNATDELAVAPSRSPMDVAAEVRRVVQQQVNIVHLCFFCIANKNPKH